MKKTILVFSGDLDKVLAGFIMANAALAMDDEVTMFFTFWGMNALRKPRGPAVAKSFLEGLFGAMMPKGPDRLKLSQMHMGGVGTSLMKQMMRKKNVRSVPELIATAQELGVRIVACSMSMDVMGLRKEELLDGVHIAGAATFWTEADESNVTLFI